MTISSIAERGSTEATSILDDADTQGMAMSAQSRADLMLKLARDTDLVHQLPSSESAVSAIQAPTSYVLLLNAYDPDEELLHGGQFWLDNLTQEIHEECSKFGNLLHIKVLGTKVGEVFMKYDDVPSAQLAVAALNGRWFAGKQIQAMFVPQAIYQNRCGPI